MTEKGKASTHGVIGLKGQVSRLDRSLKGSSFRTVRRRTTKNSEIKSYCIKCTYAGQTCPSCQ